MSDTKEMRITAQVDAIIKALKDAGCYERGDRAFVESVIRFGLADDAAITMRIENGELVFSFFADGAVRDELERIEQAQVEQRFALNYKYPTNSEQNGVQVNVSRQRAIQTTQGAKVNQQGNMGQAFQQAASQAQAAASQAQAQAAISQAEYDELNARFGQASAENDGLKAHIGTQDAEFTAMNERFNKVLHEQRLSIDRLSDTKMTALKYGAAAAVGIGCGILIAGIWYNVKK